MHCDTQMTAATEVKLFGFTEPVVKITRSLDQLGPGEDGENLANLWKALSVSSATLGYAAEQASLRWLLKVMNASTKAFKEHETIRRYPLTWNILNHIFNAIPLSNLVKALTDRKFIAVLQQTLDDLSRPTSTKNHLNSSSERALKRKRTPEPPFNLDELKTPENCIRSAQAVFTALDSLLARFGDAPSNATGFAYDARTLFPSFAAEALKLVGSMFEICALANQEGVVDTCGRGSWTTIPNEIWSLRFPRPADTGMLAGHPLCQTVFRLLMNMELDRTDYQARSVGNTSGHPTRAAWGASLYKFLLGNIIGPTSRDVMFKDGTLLKLLVNTIQRLPPRVFQTLYELAQDCPAPFNEALRERIHDWMNEVLKAISVPLLRQDLETRSSIMRQILAAALAKGTRIREGILESICLDYGFEGDKPLWPLLALTLKIDPDIVFRLVGEETLLERIRRCLLVGVDIGKDLSDVMDIAEAILRAFNNRKSLGDFFKLWYEDLSILEKVLQSDSSRTSPLLDTRFRYGSSESWIPAAMAERFMAASQLASFLDWLLSLDHLQPGPTHVIVESLANALRSSEFTDAVGPKLVQLVLKTLNVKNIPPPMQNLEWPALAKMVGWLTPEDRDSLWRQVEHRAQETLKESDPDRQMGALKFLAAAWLAMVPDGEYQDCVVSTLLMGQDELLGTQEEVLTGISHMKREDVLANDRAITALRCYLNHLVLETSKSVVLLHGFAGEKFSRGWDAYCSLLEAERGADVVRNGESVSSAEPLLRGLIRNENNLNDRAVIGYVVDKIIESFVLSVKVKRDLKGKLFSSRTTRLLVLLPNECITRPQREKLLGTIFDAFRRPAGLSDVPIPQLELLLSLVAKIMKHPTFYEGMALDDLVVLSQGLSSAFFAHHKTRPSEESNKLTILYWEVATSTIRQMATHFEKWGMIFFNGAPEWTKESRDVNWPVLHQLLLAALIHVLRGFPSIIDQFPSFNIESLSQCLAEMVGGNITGFPSQESDSELWEGNDASSSPRVMHLLVSLKASEALERGYLAGLFTPQITLETRKWSKKRAEDGLLRGWRVLAFLLRRIPEPEDIMLDIFALNREVGAPRPGEAPLDLVTRKELPSLVLECTDAVLTNLKPAEKTTYVLALLDRLLFVHANVEVLAVRRGVEHIIGLITNDGDRVDISPIYSRLVTAARTSKSGQIFSEFCSLLHLILDSSARISQENIDATLCLAASFASSEENSIRHLKGSRKPYEWLCKLVELIVKKYRLRIEGHFHALIQTLQALLTSLLRHPYDADRRLFVASPPAGDEESRFRYWREHATAYNRLLTAVCEPTAGSAARLHGNSKQQKSQTLDAVADVAKRAAGRRMYLVLAAYVRLQVEAGVPRSVREALEPGVHAIFDVTSQEVRRALGDALDREGREILGGMYREYRKFGKWSGK